MLYFALCGLLYHKFRFELETSFIIVVFGQGKLLLGSTLPVTASVHILKIDRSFDAKA